MLNVINVNKFINKFFETSLEHSDSEIYKSITDEFNRQRKFKMEALHW